MFNLLFIQILLLEFGIWNLEFGIWNLEFGNTMATLYLLRHGQASFMSDNYDRLSDLGIEQAKLLGQYFKEKEIQIDIAYTGTMERQKDTYLNFKKVYDGKIQMPQNIVLGELNEHQFTEVFDDYRVGNPKLMTAIENASPQMKRKVVMKAFFRAYREWITGKTGEGHESWEAFKLRVNRGFAEIEEALSRNETVAVFSSGGVISYMMGIIMELKDQYSMELNWQIKNASITEMNYSKGRFYLRGFNFVEHLGDDKVTFV